MNSTHVVEVVPVELLEHPNADSLSIVKIWHYVVVVRTEDWQGKTIGAYIPPDSIAPDTPEFEFLGSNKRIKARRFRGVMSQGLLWPVDNLKDAKIGDNVADQLGITHYEPPLPPVKTGGKVVSGPQLAGVPDYDLESWFRYGEAFKDEEPVYITEKIHGCNARYQYNQKLDQFFCGSHHQWKSPEDENVWWKIAKDNPWIEEWCRKYPDHTLYGEIFGSVQSLNYGCKQGEVKFLAFDCLAPGGVWVDAKYLYHLRKFDIDFSSWEMVPLLYVGPYSDSVVEQFLEGTDKYNGKSIVEGANNIREGICIRTDVERWEPICGRMYLKAVSPEYLAKVK